ncbi:hypothetical protein Cgig2_011904 [Carnegiea gigantea]|uniref:Uncharacterized protein n=1 Tax=Carnegiea gigantea TaxID=171969 RepID=A0A9Q1GGG7_9CARY|nr:hypothetical protein Cgig2_011904 [Carnegiea gigantea]
MYKGVEIHVQVGDVEMMNKEQEGPVGLGNVEHELSKKLKIKHVAQGFAQLIKNLNDKQKEAVKEISFVNFLYLQVDMIPGKLAVWLVRNFDACSCSLLLAHGRMRVTEHNVHMTLGLPNGPLSIPKCGKVIEMMQSQADGGEDFRRNFVMFVVSTCLVETKEENFHFIIWLQSSSSQCVCDSYRWANDEIKSRVGEEFKIGFGKGYLENSLDKTIVTEEEEEANEKEHRNKSVESEAKIKDQIGLSKVKSTASGSHDKIRGVASWRMPPLKRVRKVVVESTSDVLIRDTPKKSKSRTLEKQALPKGVVLLDLELNIPTLEV